MMTKRASILFISLFLFLSAMVVYHGWQIFQLNRHVEISIKRQLLDLSNERLKVQSVSPYFLGLELKNVIFSSPNNQVHFWAEAARIDYNWKSFISTGFNLTTARKHVVLHRPRIIIEWPSSRQNAAPLTAFDPAAALKPLFTRLAQSVDYLPEVDFYNGEIYHSDSTTHTLNRLVTNVNGKAHILAGKKVIAALAGRIVPNGQVVVLRSSVDVLAGSLDSLEITIPKFTLHPELQFVKIPYIIPERGTLAARVVLSQPRPGGALDIRGGLKLQGADLMLRTGGLAIRNLDLHASIRGEEILLQSRDFDLNGSSAHIEGRIDGLIDPRLHLELISPAFHIDAFAREFLQQQEVPLTGTGHLSITLQGGLRQPRFVGNFSADSMWFAAQRLSDVHLELGFQESTCTVRQFRAISRKARLSGWGKFVLDPAGDRVEGKIVAEGDFGPSLSTFSPIRIPGANGTLVADVEGLLNSPRATGRFAFQLADTTSSPLEVLGRFDLAHWDMTFEGRATNAPFRMSGHVDDVHAKSEFSIGVEHVDRLASIFPMPTLSALAGRYRMDASVNGMLDSLILQIDGYTKSSEELEFSSTFELTSTDAPAKSLSGILRFYPTLNNWFTTRFSAVSTDSMLVFTQLGNERWLTGHLQIALRGARDISGVLKFQNVELEKLFQNNNDKKLRIAGRGFGEIKFSGTLDAPLVQANAWLMNASFNGQGVYDVEASIDFKNEVLWLNKLEIKRNGQQQLSALGHFSFADRKTDIRIRGQNFDFNTLLLTLTGKDSILTGQTSIAMQFTGVGWPLRAYGQVNLRKGTALWFNFDELQFDMGSPDDSLHHSYLSDAGLEIARIVLVRDDEFILEGGGRFPLNTSDSMRVELTGTGDFLSLLTDVAPVITKTKSIGKLNLSLIGPYKKVVLGPSNLQVYNGKLDLLPIAREVREIMARITTDRDFISIDTVSGKIDNRRFQLKNHRAIAVENKRPAEPLIIDDDWMSLGILDFRTEPPGLPLYIPGIMEPGEVGQFWFKGQEVDENDILDHPEARPFKSKYGFIIAGPWKHPLFRGEVVLNNTNVTYPLLETDEPPNPIIVNLLMNADWDVRAIAGKDNSYVRNINYGLTSVYVNIGIDDNVSRLHFTGIARDTSTVTGNLPAVGVNLGLQTQRLKPQDGRNGETALDTVQSRKSWEHRLRELKRAMGPDTSSFRIVGTVESTRGTIEYMDLIFRVDKFGAIWDRSELQPILYGKAWATVPDSLNYTRNVYLVMSARDPITGAKSNRGRMEDIYFDLESDFPIATVAYDQSRIRLLEALGLSLNRLDDMRGRATEALASSTDQVLFQQLVRPIERQLEKSLGLDIFRLNSRLARNFFALNQSRVQSELALALFRSTKLTIGKYLSNRMYLLYTGQVAAWPMNFDYTVPTTLGLRHTLGFEYRINPSLLLQMEYDYNSTLVEPWREDKRIWLRHSFPF